MTLLQCYQKWRKKDGALLGRKMKNFSASQILREIILSIEKCLFWSVLGALMLEQELLEFPNCEGRSVEIAKFFDHSDFT